MKVVWYCNKCTNEQFYSMVLYVTMRILLTNSECSGVITKTIQLLKDGMACYISSKI